MKFVCSVCVYVCVCSSNVWQAMMMMTFILEILTVIVFVVCTAKIMAPEYIDIEKKERCYGSE